MVKIELRWKLAEDLNLLRGAPAWTKVKHFWRKGWTEIPVIMGSSFLGAIGVGLIWYTIWHCETHDLTPKYYQTSRIYRPDDPRVQKIRHTSVFDQ